MQITAPDGQLTQTRTDRRGRRSALLVAALALVPSTALAEPGTWTPTGSMLMERGQSFSATLLPGGRVLVAGGVNGDGRSIEDAEIFNPSTGTWAPAPPMNRPRSRHTAVLLPNGRVLVAGGVTVTPDGGEAATRTAELFDPASRTWVETGSMSADRYHHTATLMTGGRVVIVGGAGNAAPFVHKTAEIYDPSTGRFQPIAPLTKHRFLHRAIKVPDGPVLYRGIKIPDGPVLIVTGGDFPSHCDSLRTAEVYDPVADAWSPIASMSDARSAHVDALLPDGRVLVAGGWSLPVGTCPVAGPTSMTASSQVLDATTGQWQAAGSLGSPRGAIANVQLSDGRVLIAGGRVPDGDRTARTATAELFDPGTLSWSPTGSMRTPRVGHAMVVLADGRVLAAGGFGPAGALASAEIYTP